MRCVSIFNHKTGSSLDISLDTLPAAQLQPEPLPTQGVEAEFLIRQAATLEPAPAEKIVSLFGQQEWRSAEPPAHCCEIKTEPHRTAGTLLAEYRERVGWLCRWAATHDLLVVPVGAEPLARDYELSAYGFIRRVADQKYGAATLALSHGMSTQVNTHIADGAALLAGYRGLVRLAPVLAGMFASSPFAGGRCAGVLAYRHVVRRVLLNGGDPEQLPPSLRWEDYMQSHNALTAMGTWFPACIALNGMVRLRADRMCIESGITDLVADPRHLAGLVELTRRLIFRVLCCYRDGERLPSWFLPDDPAVQDAAFRTSMLSAVKMGSQGLSCSSELRPLQITQIFEQLIAWVKEPGVPDDPSLPWADAEAGLRDLVEYGSPAERYLREFHELHRDCPDPFSGCPGCAGAIVEICRRSGRDFAALFETPVS